MCTYRYHIHMSYPCSISVYHIHVIIYIYIIILSYCIVSYHIISDRHITEYNIFILFHIKDMWRFIQDVHTLTLHTPTTDGLNTWESDVCVKYHGNIHLTIFDKDTTWELKTCLLVYSITLFRQTRMINRRDYWFDAFKAPCRCIRRHWELRLELLKDGLERIRALVNRNCSFGDSSNVLTMHSMKIANR